MARRCGEVARLHALRAPNTLPKTLLRRWELEGGARRARRLGAKIFQAGGGRSERSTKARRKTPIPDGACSSEGCAATLRRCYLLSGFLAIKPLCLQRPPHAAFWACRLLCVIGLGSSCLLCKKATPRWPQRGAPRLTGKQPYPGPPSARLQAQEAMLATTPDQYDIDFVSTPIPVSCIPLFADQWVLGGWRSMPARIMC